jgi:uncharacterized membrane protein YqjE
MLERLSDLFRKYLELRLEIFKVDLQEQAQKLFVKALMGFLWLFFGSAALLFFCFALAFYFNHLLESKYIGFIIIGLVFFISLIVSLSPLVRKKLANRINQYFSQNKE